MNIKDRAINKAQSKVAWLDLEYVQTSEETPSIGMTEELIQVRLDYNRREKKTWEYILKQIK